MVRMFEKHTHHNYITIECSYSKSSHTVTPTHPHTPTHTHTEVSVVFNVESVTVEESDGMFRMCVSLNRPAAENIIVSLATEDGSAIDGQGV